MLLLLLLAASPLQTLKDASVELRALAEKPDTRGEEIFATVDRVMDIAELAKRSFGSQWDTLTASQQQEVSTKLRSLMRASYANRSKRRAEEPVVTTWGEQTVNGDEAKVSSTVPLAGDRLTIEYLLFKKTPTSPWRVYDIVTDGTSLVEAFGDQFRATLAKKGFAGLIDALDKRKAKLEAQSAAPDAGSVLP
jgi:phospholipid transport system substrate-binding protein